MIFCQKNLFFFGIFLVKNDKIFKNIAQFKNLKKKKKKPVPREVS